MPVRLPVSGGGPPPEPPPYGGLGHGGWARGRTFLELVEQFPGRRTELEAAFAAVAAEDTSRAFFAACRRRVRILALVDLDAFESRLLLAQMERLCTWGRTLWMRAFLLSENTDLRQLFPSPELPLFVFFGDDGREFARWGPRPRPLQEEEAAAGELTAAQRDTLRQRFHARSGGRDLAQEVQKLLAAHGV